MSTVTFSDPFAAVEIQPLQVAGETVPTRVAVRIKSDEGPFSVAGIVGRDYQLLSNRKVRDIAEDIMSRCPSTLGGFRGLKTLFDGKRYVDYFASNQPIISLHNGRATDLKLGLMVWNSYDGTRKVGFEIFALNPFCTNQYHSRNRFGFFAWRHQPGEAAKIDVDDALQNISNGIQNIVRAAPLMEEMKHTPLSLPLILDIKAGTKMPQSRWGDVLDELKAEEATKWGIYQAMTNVASHKLNGLSAIDIGSSITDHFLGDPSAKPVMNHTTAAAVIGEDA
jgi:hypothetical protein